MVERQLPAHLVKRRPGGGLRVRPGDRDRQVGGDRQVGHADDPAARVAVRRAVGGELLQVQGRPVKPGLLAQLPLGRLAQVLVRAQETAGQRGLAPVRLVVALDDEHVQQVVAHREDREVDGEAQAQVVSISHTQILP